MISRGIAGYVGIVAKCRWGQVIKEWKNHDTTDGMLDVGDKERWNARLRNFFRDKVRKKEKNAAVRTQANSLSLLALEHGMQVTLGIDFRRFMPALKPKALNAHEERFFLDVADLPANLKVHARRRWSCIIDHRTGETRLEAS